MPVRRHFDLAFGTDPDHVNTTLLVRIPGDDGHFNAGYERLPDQLAWRDDYWTLRESKNWYQQDRRGEDPAREFDGQLLAGSSHGHLTSDGWRESTRRLLHGGAGCVGRARGSAQLQTVKKRTLTVRSA